MITMKGSFYRNRGEGARNWTSFNNGGYNYYLQNIPDKTKNKYKQKTSNNKFLKFLRLTSSI